MNVLFVTMAWPKSGLHNMYTDLMDEFVEEKHSVCVATLSEKRNNIETNLSHENGVEVLRVKCGNIQKTNKYEKVISSFFGGYQLKHSVYRYFRDKRFDVIIFALPPLTIALPLIQVKKHYKAKMYLLLKEFWPQDPADLGAMSVGGLVWKVFSFLEKKLYKNSDYVGTMSKAGITYIRQNSAADNCVVEECPNSQKDTGLQPYSDVERKEIRERYHISDNEVVFIFGGNLGVSQGIPEMVKSIQLCEDVTDARFIIVGDGTEANVIKEGLKGQTNVTIIDRLPQSEYEKLVFASEVGLVFLYPKYTVPNIPSRMVTYMMYGLPVIACVDHATDAGKIIEEHQCGVSLYNGDIDGFRNAVIRLMNQKERQRFSMNSRALFEKKYTTRVCYDIIVKHFI